jgi:hypothetical protein
MERRPARDLRERTFLFAADILRFADAIDGVSPMLTPLLTESNELIAILTAVVRRARENATMAEGRKGR